VSCASVFQPTGHSLDVLPALTCAKRIELPRRSSGIVIGNRKGAAPWEVARPDAWRYLTEVQDAGRPANATGYR
jgi:hypothetical protein